MKIHIYYIEYICECYNSRLFKEKIVINSRNHTKNNKTKKSYKLNFFLIHIIILNNRKLGHSSMKKAERAYKGNIHIRRCKNGQAPLSTAILLQFEMC